MNNQIKQACGKQQTNVSEVALEERPTSDRSTCCQTQLQPDSLKSTMVRLPRVLLVDDNRNWSDPTAEYLADEGFDVSTALDGVDALHRLRNKEFEVAVLDINMPRMNGFEMMLELKRLNIEIPVIMVTAKPEDFDESVVLALGAKMYLPKPINMETLVDAIERCARRGET